MSAAIHPMPSEGRAALPENVEAEQALLGAILCDNRAYDQVGDFLRAEHFHHAVHAEIFAACAKAIEAGRRVDAVSLKHHFAGHEDLAHVGGAGYLAELVAAVPSIINARDYGQAIHDCALRREQIVIYREQIVRAHDMDQDATGQDILEETEARLQGVAEGNDTTGAQGTADSIPEFKRRIRARRAAGGGLLGLPTGFTDLDRLTSGLIAPQVIVLAARPSMGKTSLATNIATRVAGNREPVLFYSLEMAREELELRMVAERAGISGQRLQRADDLTDHEMLDIDRAADAIQGLPIYIDDSSRLTVQAMLTRARRLQRRRGLKLIIVDHIGYVRGPQRRDSRTLELGDIMKAFRGLAKALHVPVMVLCQLNRANQQRDDKRPQLSDLRQSGEIEEDADQVWFVHRDYYYLKRTEPVRKVGQSDDAYKVAHAEWLESCGAVQHQADIIVAKNRNGPQDTAKLYFDEATMRFDNLQRQQEMM